MEEQTEQSKPTPIEFVKDKLKQNPEAPFAEIKAQGRLEGLTIYPVVYGRAKALLGLIPTAPYGSKAKARRKAKEEKLEAQEPAPTRTLNSDLRRKERSGRKGGDPFSSLEQLVEDLKTAVEERDRYRTVLEKILQLLQSELR